VSTTLQPVIDRPSLDRQLVASSIYCRQITRKHAKNFYYGLKLTPEPKRSAMYAVYAWMRAADDLADDVGHATDKTARLEAFRRQTLSVIDSDQCVSWKTISGSTNGIEKIWPAIGQAIRNYHIPNDYLHAMIDGQLIDQHQVRYDSFEQLYDYCYKVASVVGLICIKVWGYTGGQTTEKLAEYRGIGLQLTNILRDLVEDAQRGRVYLPASDLERFGFTPDTFAQQLMAGPISSEFEALMADQVARARRYYDMSAELEDYLDRSCRSTSWAIVEIYRRLLESIARQPRLVLTQTVGLRRSQKLGIALRAAWTKGLRR